MQVDFNIPRASDAGYVNNQREHYEYKFNGIIPPDAKQDEVSVCGLCAWLAIEPADLVPSQRVLDKCLRS